MFPTGNDTGPAPAMYNQPPLQTTPSQPQISQAYYNQPNQSPYNLHFPPLMTNQITTNQAQLPQLNQQSYHKVQPTYVFNPSKNQISSSTQPNSYNRRSDTTWYSEEDPNMSEEGASEKHQWQTVSNNRERTNYRTPDEISEQIQTTNRFDSLDEPPCDSNQNKQPPTPTNLAIPIKNRKTFYFNSVHTT
jgi:hypothetical protein